MSPRSTSCTLRSRRKMALTMRSLLTSVTSWTKLPQEFSLRKVMPVKMFVGRDYATLATLAGGAYRGFAD